MLALANTQRPRRPRQRLGGAQDHGG
jgi:hypothetical protein